jgi:malonyl-CoA O-methyltransferase
VVNNLLNPNDTAPGDHQRETGPVRGTNVDAQAVARSLRRLDRAPQSPWLWAEIHGRMVERLAWFATKPATVLHWWGHLDGGWASLQAALPDARILTVAVAATDAGTSASPPAPTAARPWWSRWRGVLGWTPRGMTAATRRPTTVASNELAAGQAHMVWSVAALDKVTHPAELFARWHTLLADEGVVMVATLGPDTLRELRALYRKLGWGPCGRDHMDMHDVGDALVHAGFADPVMDQEQLTLTWDDPKRLLAELRSLGGNAAPTRFSGLRTPRWQRRLEQALRDELTGPDGRMALTIEVVYGHAFKPAPRPRSQPGVSLDALRATLPSHQAGS